MASWSPSQGTGVYPLPSATPSLVAPTTRTTQPDELLSNQIKNVIDTNNPLMQQAETTAKQTANKSGLLNSSLAVGAAQNAVLGQAVPIATHQANTITANNNATYNQNYDAAKANQAAQNTAINAQVDNQTKMQLADVEASYKTLMQADDSAMKTYQNSVNAINDIMMDSTMTPAAKQQAVANQNQILKTGMQMIAKMNNLNLDSLLTFPTYTG